MSFRHRRSDRTALTRRAALAGGAAALALVGAAPALAFHATDVGGALPPLEFTMTRASDGKVVTAADVRGKVVILFFGYTSCPDICPTTLMNAATMLKSLGKRADDVRFLFVTVDPNRDTLSGLKQYTESFAPQIVGLRGTPDQLATLAKRYRVAYSVTPAGDGHDYEVSHSTAAYVFDRDGNVQLLFTDLAAPNVKLGGMTADLREMVAGTGVAGWWQRMLNLI